MAYQPRFIGVNLRNNPPTPIQRFILANKDLLNHETGRDLDFQLGFAGCRRTELVRIAKRYKLDINETAPAETIMAQMEAYFDQGKLPVPSEEDKNKQQLKEMLLSLTQEEKRELLGEKKVGRPPKVSDGVHAS